MRCRPSPRWRFCGQLSSTGRTWEEIGIRSPWRYTGLCIVYLQLWLFFKCPAVRVRLLLGLRHTSPLSCLILNWLSVAVKGMGHVYRWSLESDLWLNHLLLRLWEWLLSFWVILVLLASCLRGILVIKGLRETVWDWRR